MKTPENHPPNPSPTTTAGISAVIPVLDSAATLAGFVEELAAALGELGRPFEVILVNDGSRDRTWDVVRGLAQRDPRVRGFDLMRNYGQHNALLCGIRAARYGLVATLDDDGQHPPAAIRDLLGELERGSDVVYGTPARRQHGLWRNLASGLTKVALRRVLGAESARNAGPFRLFRTRLREAFADYASPAVSIEVLLSWATTRFSSVTVEHRPRAAGTSNYGLRRLTQHALDMVTGFSTLPLHLASWVGFLLTLFGVVILAVVLTNYFVRGSVPGFSFLASIIVILGGGQLFAIGMIGEYLARMHWRSMNRPPFAIAATAGGSAAAGDQEQAGAEAPAAVAEGLQLPVQGPT